MKIEANLPDINQFYDNLIPSRFDGLTVYILHQKILENQIPVHFTYRDLQDAIRDVANLEPSQIPHTEKVLQTLLHFFLEHPANKGHHYMLSDYAEKFVALIKNKLDNPLKKYPLRETFKRYADFNPESIKSINDFLEWYDLQFQLASQQTVFDHLESLKDDVNVGIKKLNAILSREFEDASRVAAEFSDVFKNIGKRSDEIKDTLKLSGAIDTKVRAVVAYFKTKIEEYKHPENEKERVVFHKLKSDFEQAIMIHNKVSAFFDRVDEKLQQLIDKSLFASAQLNHLQENFRYQSRFRLNIKRFLKFTLEQASYSKEGPVLPNKFPKKKLIKETFRFRWPRYKESFSPPVNLVIPQEIDLEHQQKEKAKIELEIEKQQTTAKLARYYKEMLKENKELDFTKQFYKIIEDRNDTEVALNVGFELFEYAGNNSEYKIDIEKKLPSDIEMKDAIIWKMKITSIN